MSTFPPTPSWPNLHAGQRTEETPCELVEADLLVAHSLRTPLTAIKSALELLCQSDLPTESQRFASMAQRNTDRLIELVERLLTGSSARS